MNAHADPGVGRKRAASLTAHSSADAAFYVSGKQQGRHGAIFLRQHIVGAAGCAKIHRLQRDLPARKRPAQWPPHTAGLQSRSQIMSAAPARRSSSESMAALRARDPSSSSPGRDDARALARSATRISRRI